MMTHFDELKLIIETNKPDIIGISETKLDKTVNDCDVHISVYRVIRRDRNCYGGGVLMYISESLNFNHREDLDFDLESISVEIKVGKYKPFLVTTIYRPPDKPVSYFDQIESLISTTDLEGKESILIGDLNCDFLCESNNNIKNLKRIIFTYGFSQLIKEPTRTTSDTKTIIDHIITNRTDLVSSSGIIYCGISDHDIVFMQKECVDPSLNYHPKQFLLEISSTLTELNSYMIYGWPTLMR